jgi:membrane glycosyltransferase
MAYVVSPSLAAWMAPVVIGMALAIPVVAVSSSRAVGLWLRQLRILSIPEEQTPPPVLLRAGELRRAAAARRAAG